MNILGVDYPATGGDPVIDIVDCVSALLQLSAGEIDGVHVDRLGLGLADTIVRNNWLHDAARPPCIETVCILGKDYRVVFCDNACDVHPECRMALWGHMDWWDKEIRVLRRGGAVTILHTIIHEIIHAIVQDLTLSAFGDNEGDIDRVACGLADALVRNGLLHLDLLSKLDPTEMIG